MRYTERARIVAASYCTSLDQTEWSRNISYPTPYPVILSQFLNALLGVEQMDSLAQVPSSASPDKLKEGIFCLLNCYLSNGR